MEDRLKVVRALAGFILSGERAKYEMLVELLGKLKGSAEVAKMEQEAWTEAIRLMPME